MQIIEEHDNVDHIPLGDRSIYLVGTAHISKKSVELAEEIIREIKPDSVAVELCHSRYESLKNPDRWKNMDIVQIIRQGKSYVLMAQLMLAGFQKKLGSQLDIKPGAEMMQAIKVADDVEAETVLADRDIRTTLKRTWSALGFWSMVKLIATMITGLFSKQSIKEEEIERLKSSDALEELMKEFSDALPGARKALIDERDQYLAAKIRSAPGTSVVAVIGAGHVPGIKEWIHKDIDLDELTIIPPPGKVGRIVAWSIPVLLLVLVGIGFFRSGATTSLHMLEAWFWINGGLAAVGAALALGHPLTVIAAFFAAPFTSVNPFISAGWVAGLVEAAVRRPTVQDFEEVADDIVTMRGFLKNRISRILLVVILTTLFSAVATFIGFSEIASQL